jgi:DNA-binding transcriptional ArsR family regulator
MNIMDLEDKADEAAEFLSLLGSPQRLRLLCLLIQGEMSVGELADATKTRQSVVSQHLALLRAHKIVSTRREGTSIFYSIENPAARAMIETLHRIYCEPAKARGKKPARKK